MVKVSVIVPVYNATHIMDKCLQSLLGQTYEDFEMILVDDGSTDDSYARLQDYENKCSNIRVFTQSNQGQSIARNVGIQHAQGEFICFVDIDDYVHIDLLSTLINEQRKTGADIVWCNAFVEQGGEIIGTLDDTMLYHAKEEKRYVLNNAGPWRKLIRASIVKEKAMHFPSIRYYEDVAIVPSYGLYAHTIQYVNTPLYYYLLHEGSTMHQKEYNEKLECIFTSLEHLKQSFQRNNQLEEYADEVEWIYIDHLLHAASLRFFAFQRKECLDKIVSIMKMNYAGFKKNPYFKKKDWKYRLICSLFFNKKYKVLSMLLK